MLTPPPSPLPPPAKPSAFPLYPDDPDPDSRKQAAGRRYTLAIILVPLLLLLLSFSSLPSLCHPSWPPRNPPKVYPATTSPALIKRASSVPTVPTGTSSSQNIVPTPFPQPFDLSLSWNFTTSSCQNFFLNFTQSDNFRRCRPFSFLLGTSSQFTEAQSNLTLLNSIIWGTCNTVQTNSECQDFMNSYGSGLQSQCKVELQQNTALAEQAMVGFQLYEPMRQAGCLINNNTNTYCFLEAAASSSPADLYFYQLPYGHTLPNGTVPSCSSCIQNVLSIYGHVVAHPPTIDVAVPQNASIPALGTQNVANSIPLDATYSQAAQLASQECGSVYVQQASASSATIIRVSYLVLFSLTWIPFCFDLLWP